MDNASDYESGDCRFDPCQSRNLFFTIEMVFFTKCHTLYYPLKKQTGFWGEFTMEWDDETERVLSGFYMRWTVGGEGWTWPSGTWVQNYAQFENPIKPGNYRAVTCSALYNRKEGAALNYVMGY